MIASIQKTPQHWLSLDLCRTIFNTAKSSDSDYFTEPAFFDDRYEGRLEGILGSVPQTWDGKLLHPTILKAASAYLFKFIRLHPFHDGNKHFGVLFTHVFLQINDVDFTLPENDFYLLAVNIAKNQNKTDEELLKICEIIIKENTKEL